MTSRISFRSLKRLTLALAAGALLFETTCSLDDFLSSLISALGTSS